MLGWEKGVGAAGGGAVKADGWRRADFAFGAATGPNDFDIAGCILVSMSLARVSWERGDSGRLTAGQQESPQQISPSLQKASEQQVEFLGMQKGAFLEDLAMQQVTGFHHVSLPSDNIRRGSLLKYDSDRNTRSSDL